MGHIVELSLCEECGERCEPGERFCRLHKHLKEDEKEDHRGTFLDEATKKEDGDFV